MLEKLRKLNPEFPVYSVNDPEFIPYGKVITGYDTSEIVAACKAIPHPESGSAYVPTEPSLEATAIAKEINSELFGEMPAQIGLCWGHNTKLNALEYHLSSEINIAATPLVLLLALEPEIVDGKLDVNKVKAFYLEEGEMVEVFGTSLHYCPCQVDDSGFSAVVALHKGTNLPLTAKHPDPYLFAANKWLLACEDSPEHLENGAVAGLIGKNYELKY